MINFSAFPVRKHRLGLHQVAAIVLLAVAVLFALVYLVVFIAGDEIGMIALQLVTLSIGAIAIVTLTVIVVYWARGVVWRRIKDSITGKSLMYAPPGIIPTLRQFAADNGFQFIEYAPETPAPPEMYMALQRKPLDSRDDIYALYELSGRCCKSNFRYYCLAYTDQNHGIGYYERQSRAYAHLRDGRAVDYVTVLAVDRPIRPWYKGAVNAINAPNGFIYCHGQVRERELAQKIFKLAEKTIDAG